MLRQGVGWRGPGSLNVIFADVRGPAGGRVPEGGRLLARMRGLGWRALAHPGVGPDNIAIRVRRPRRYDEDGPLAIARPAYGVVPRIDRLRCQAYQGCRFCLGVCPEEALVPLGENVELLSYRCQGCGGCVAACRFGAVEYPMWSDAEPLAEVAGLMAGPEAPGVVVLACPYALNALPERVAWPDGVEAVALPCLARLDPALVLYAALLGAGVAVLGCPGTCGRRLCAAGPRRAAVFARRALEAGGWPVTVIWIEPEELVERGWSPFPPLAAARADSEGERPAGAGPVVQPSPGVPRLADLVARCLESRAGLRLEGGDVPFGWVEAHGARCNGCGACVRRCPTAALRFREEAGTVELRFTHDRCVACGFCVAACPARALVMRRLVDADWLGGGEAVLVRLPAGPVRPR